MEQQYEPLFSVESGIGTVIELVPHGTLAWAGIHVRGFKQSRESGMYADLELTVAEGPYEGRKIWEKICDPYDKEKNSEGWRKMAKMSLTRIFESSGVFDPRKPESYEQLNGLPFEKICEILDGQVAAIKIKIEKPKEEGFAEKNAVADWLSPNEKSGGYKGFIALVNPKKADPVAARKAAFSPPAQTNGPTDNEQVAQSLPAAAKAPVVGFNRPSIIPGTPHGGMVRGARPAWIK